MMAAVQAREEIKSTLEGRLKLDGAYAGGACSGAKRLRSSVG
jgi:hypothetical protein